MTPLKITLKIEDAPQSLQQFSDKLALLSVDFEERKGHTYMYGHVDPKVKRVKAVSLTQMRKHGAKYAKDFNVPFEDKTI